MNSDKQRKISDILQQFNRQVAKIFKVIDKYHPDNVDIQHVKQILSLCRDITPDRIIREAGEKLWDQRENIMKRDVYFFFRPDNMSRYAGDKETKDLVEAIVTFVRDEYNTLKPDEIEYIWNCVNLMLKHTIEFKIIQGEYVE